MKKNSAPDPGWAPEFTLDLERATNQAFQQLLEAFEKSTRALETLPPLPVRTGWNTVTPECAEQLLRHNRPGSNREPALSVITYYYAQMKAGIWVKTGQGIIFTQDGCLQDGQQRLWACYLGGVSFDTYIIADVPVQENMFAYMDNGRSRNAAAALQTSGTNGLSTLINQTIQISHFFDIGAYTWAKKRKVVKLAPIQVLDYFQTHKEIRAATHLAAGEYKEASQAIGYRDVAAYVIYRIITLHDEDVCDRFMSDISLDRNEPLFEPDPVIKVLNSFLLRQTKTKDPLAKHQILGHVIEVFNKWVTGEPVKSAKIDMGGPFPDFVAAADKADPGEEAA